MTIYYATDDVFLTNHPAVLNNAYLLSYSMHPDIEAHAFSIIDWEYAIPFINEIKNRCRIMNFTIKGKVDYWVKFSIPFGNNI